MKSRSNGHDEEQRRLAVLIDADNAEASVIEGLLAEVAKYGVASVRRIYGDFTSTRLSQWKAALLKHSIQPIQQFAYTTGKNATDSSLIIDAMDLLYTGRFHGFCLVSSDSDFTRLAQRLREGGMTVYGFGKETTPESLRQACDKFIRIEVLRTEQIPAPVTKVAAAPAKPVAPTPPVSALPVVNATKKTAPKPAALPELPIALIRQAIEEASDEQGWAQLAATGSYLNKIRSDFDPRLYGHKKLSDLLREHPKHFAVEERAAAGNPKVLYVRSLS